MRFLILLTAWAFLASPSVAALYHFLPLNDNAANSTVTASTGVNGTAKDGVASRNTSTVQVGSGPNGTINYAFAFDGSNDYVSWSGYHFGLTQITTDVTVSLWFKTSSFASAKRFCGNEFNARYIGAGDATTINVVSSSASGAFTVPAMSTDTWHHLFVVRTHATSATRVWIDGVPSSSNPIAIDGLLSFAVLGQANSVYANCQLSQFRVWNSDESADVATWYAEGVDSNSVINPLSASIPGVARDPLTSGIGL